MNTVEQARQYTRRFARTFYFASHVLPPDKRGGAYAVYAFCRYADNIADAGGGAGEDAQGAAHRLAALRRELDQLYGDSGEPAGRWLALRETIRRFGIPKRYFVELLDGVAMDLAPTPFHTFSELEVYCYRVASVVGLIMCHVFGATSEEALQHAADLGTAMQLTNILRDIGEDYDMGRIYLPREEMARHGITEDHFARGSVTPALKAFLAFQIARARSFYEKARPGIALVPNDGSRFCVQLMSDLYARILGRIERNGYDVFRRRARVTLPHKLAVAVRLAARDGVRGGNAGAEDDSGRGTPSAPRHRETAAHALSERQ